MYLDAGFKLGEETLRRWTNAARAGEPIISPDKQTGAKKKVDNEQRQVATGWVLQQEKKINRRSYSGFVSDNFGVNISPGTASKYLAEFDLTRQMMGSRPRDPGISFEQYAKERYDYVVGLHNDGFFLQEPSLVWATMLFYLWSKGWKTTKVYQRPACVHGQYFHVCWFRWVNHSSACVFCQP